MLGCFGAMTIRYDSLKEFMFHLRALDFERKIRYCCKDNYFAKKRYVKEEFLSEL